MKRIEHNPTNGIYPAEDYLHAIELRGASRTVYVSGTMGLRPSGAAGTDLEEQLRLIWSNIATILASADMTVDDIVRVTSYLRDPGYVEANQSARLRALRGRRVPTTALVAQTLSEDWLVEVEVIAAA